MPQLVYFLQGVFGYRTQPRQGQGSPMRTDLMLRVANRARVPVETGKVQSNLMYDLLADAESDPELMLDVIDATLSLADPNVSGLLTAFEDAGSEWTVAEDGKSLEKRVDETARDQFAAATSAQDDAAQHLREAWHSTYGRHPNPSDAWDHAIKAVEAVLWQDVIPKDPHPTLGKIEKAIAAKPSKWNLGIESNSIGSVETLHALLAMVWVNPDRHSTQNPRVPTQSEVEGLVQIAVTIVQWTRAGLFTVAP